jgi:hypothetical protein
MAVLDVEDEGITKRRVRKSQRNYDFSTTAAKAFLCRQLLQFPQRQNCLLFLLTLCLFFIYLTCLAISMWPHFLPLFPVAPKTSYMWEWSCLVARANVKTLFVQSLVRTWPQQSCSIRISIKVSHTWYNRWTEVRSFRTVRRPGHKKGSEWSRIKGKGKDWESKIIKAGRLALVFLCWKYRTFFLNPFKLMLLRAPDIMIYKCFS